MRDKRLVRATRATLVACAIASGAAGAGLIAPAPALARDYLADARAALQKGDLRAAQIQLRNAVKDDPQNAEARYQLARVSMQLGDPAAAEREARAALDRGYEPRLATPLLAQAYLSQGHARELLNELNVSGKNPQLDAQILVARGFAQIDQRDIPAAQKSFADAEARDPKAIEPLLAESRLALGMRDLPKAKEKLNAALAIDPHSSDALVRRAEMQRIEGDIPGALATLDEVLTANPSLLPVRLERAGLLIGTNKDDAAKKDVDAVLASIPGNAQALFYRALLLAREKDYKGSDAILAKIQPAMPSLPRAFFLQAIVKQNLNQLEQAEDSARKYTARAPNDLAGLKLLAGIELLKRRPDQVIETLGKVAAGGHADAGTYDLVARAYAAQGDQRHAVEYFEKAAALAPEDQQLLTRLAASRMGMGDAEAAVADLQKSFELAPSKPAAGAALFFADLATGDLDRTAQTLDVIRKAQGETPVVRNLEGLLQLARLDLDGAKATFEGILKDNADFIPAKINLVRIAVMQGRRADADAILSGIIEKSPISEPALTMYVASMTEEKKFDAATAALEKARAAAPTDTRLAASLADYYVRAGDPNKALKLIADPSLNANANIDLLAARARAQTALKDTVGAQETYRQMLTVAPANAEARRVLVGLLVQAGNLESARAVLQEGMKVSPRNYQFMSDYVGIDLRASGVDAALATADRLEKNSADFPAARALRGDVLLSAKRYDDAIKAYSDAQKAAPSLQLLLRIAGAQTAAGKPDDAAATLRGWLTTHPDDVPVQQALAGYAITAHRYDEAETILTRVLEKAPRDPVALNNLAWLYQQKKDPRALATAEKAYLLQPSPQTADTLGWILTSDGDAARGLPLLRQANAEGNNAPIRYHLAVALKDTGQRDEAIKMLSPLVAPDVTFDEKPDATKLYGELSKG
jgi:putative PEP-CTERM system TPR-repeat lipoprotein